MTPDEYIQRHSERYRRLLWQEITLEQAARETNEDWRALQAEWRFDHDAGGWVPREGER